MLLLFKFLSFQLVVHVSFIVLLYFRWRMLLTFFHPSLEQAVLAHELGHLKCDHGVWLTFANILTIGAYTVPGALCSMFTSFVIYIIGILPQI